MAIEEAYQTLRQLGLVASQMEFSRIWLGRSPRYYSSLLARQHQPSVGTLSALRFRLHNTLTFTPDEAISRRLASLLKRVETEVARRIVCDQAR